ncbi:MAG TPA: hypothetical protein VN812_04340 [Candidatus Acidoferrales bacterium]|nr:hypothetical protein [Candidatus Acidoferrales bacterium]
MSEVLYDIGDVYPATAYEPADDLWLVTAYFNPLGYHTRRRNYERFRDVIARSGLQLLTIECAIGRGAFALPPSADVLRVRARHLLWQKERLLNLAIAQLPARCTKVAWLDCDVVFENPQWAVETSRALERHWVVQPYTMAVRLPQDADRHRDAERVNRAFASIYPEAPQHLGEGDYDKHGDTGLAWAARREALARCQLYDACIVGGGDHVMAHAMCGDWVSPCIDRLLGAHSTRREHFVRWAKNVWTCVGGNVGCVPGAALHLWHGERSNRRYRLRHGELKRFGFDPETDVRIGRTGCLEWASHKPALHRWVKEYFRSREEDGAAPPVAEGTALEPAGGP